MAIALHLLGVVVRVWGLKSGLNCDRSGLKLGAKAWEVGAWNISVSDPVNIDKSAAELDG
jgi:hypothetical protein